jgi:hypothetical protein
MLPAIGLSSLLLGRPHSVRLPSGRCNLRLQTSPEKRSRIAEWG